MAATFNTPIAGVILAIELLLFEFRSRSFIPLVIASTLATSVRSILLGQRSMFVMGNANFDALRGLPFYLLLGVICGGVAIGFTKVLYWVEDQFERIKIDELWHPAIGALALGLIGYFVPRVLGVGYDTISDILNNNLPLKILILVAIFKALALVISSRVRHVGWIACANVHVERGIGRCICDAGELYFPWRAPFSGRLRTGGDGSGLRGCVSRDIHIHRVRV